MGQPCQFCALLSLKGSDEKSVAYQQCGVMKRGPKVKASFANVRMILGKSPNLYGLRALICKTRVMLPNVRSVKHKSSQSNKIEECYVHCAVS